MNWKHTIILLGVALAPVLVLSCLALVEIAVPDYLLGFLIGPLAYRVILELLFEVSDLILITMVVMTSWIYYASLLRVIKMCAGRWGLRAWVGGITILIGLSAGWPLFIY